MSYIDTLRAAAAFGDLAAMQRVITLSENLHRMIFGNDCQDRRRAFVETVVNACDSAGNTALHYCRIYDTALLLIQNGANVRALNAYGATPLLCACSYGTEELLQLLVIHGADVNETDVNGLTPLHVAVQYNTLSAVRLLVSRGADVLNKDVNGELPLHRLVQTRCCRGEDARGTLDFLLHLNPYSVVAPNNLGNTPLHLVNCDCTAKYIIERSDEFQGHEESWIPERLLTLRNRANEVPSQTRPFAYLKSYISEPLTVEDTPLLIRRLGDDNPFLSLNPRLHHFQAKYVFSTIAVLMDNSCVSALLEETAVNDIFNRIASFLSPVDVMKRA